MKYEEGEYINLIWEGPADFAAVKGHVSEEDACHALEAFGIDPASYQEPVHQYARWSFAGEGVPDGCTHMLQLRREKGRGCFPVTVFHAIPTRPPSGAIYVATVAAKESTCAKSKRGVAIVAANGTVPVMAANGPPAPFKCDGSVACRAACNRVAVHAEERAIIKHGLALPGTQLVHVKVVDRRIVPSGPPSCWQCSRMIVGAGIETVWLYHHDGWRAYSAEEFHRLTLEHHGLPAPKEENS